MIAATCLLLGNLYYAQPILFEIAGAFRISMDDSGLIVALGQIGYITGLMLLAPLGDMADNRILYAAMSLCAGASMFLAAIATGKEVFFTCLFFMGVFASTTQVLVVFAASLSEPDHACRTLGIMACGLFMGIAFSRPASSLVTGLLGWRHVYGISALFLLAISCCLYFFLPRLQVRRAPSLPYSMILHEMIALAFHAKRFITPTILSFIAFMGFTMFWSSAPLYLSETAKRSQDFVTVFTMCGLITPPAMLLVGRLLDRGERRKIMLTAFCLISVGWLIAWAAPESLWMFFMATLLIDPCSSVVTVTVQKTIVTNVDTAMRGRANSLNVSMNFLGGTLGAALGPWLLGRLSWACVVMAGLAMAAGALIFALHEQFSERSSHNG